MQSLGSFHLINILTKHKISNFQGDLTDTSAEKQSLVKGSVAVLDEISLRTPQTYLFLLSKNIFTESKYPKKKIFFEKSFTGGGACLRCGPDLCVVVVRTRG